LETKNLEKILKNVRTNVQKRQIDELNTNENIDSAETSLVKKKKAYPSEE